MGYTLQQLQAMGAKPVVPIQPVKKGYTLQELQALGAKPVVAQPQTPDELARQNEIAISEKVNPVQNLGIGIVKGAASTAQTLGQLTLKGFNKIGLSKLINGQDYNTNETFSGNNETLKPQGVGQSLGYYGEKTAEFFAPSSAVTKGQKIITGAVDAIPLAGKTGAFVKGALGVAGRAVPEALSGAGVTYAQTGDTQQAIDAGKIQGGLSAGFGALGSAYRGLRGASDLVETGINKGIRPSVSGKGNASQVKQYMDKAKEAVSLVAGNKNLKFETNGEMVARAPKTLDEFSQAIQQTKQDIFNKYNAMAQGAGEAGRGAVVNLNEIAKSKVPLQPISNELVKVANNKVLQDTAPDVAKYALTRAQALSQRGVYTPAEAQEAIKMMNENLSAFYRNPSPELAQKISIDALVANKMRELLDSTISGLQGSGYQELKRQYGALSTIEKDVAHRAVVEARKNVKGLIDFTDVLSAGQVINGIASLHPAGIAQGITQKIVSSAIKNANSADKHIERMFGELTNPSVAGNISGRVFGGYTAKESAQALTPKK